MAGRLAGAPRPRYAALVTRTDDHSATRAYYDEFSKTYERHRGDADPGGYHALVDDLEVDFVSRWAKGGDALEVGCGTGLILSRVADVARSAKGIDLSPGMLDVARARGLDVREASATAIPFADASFDVTYSFKVLAHVPDLRAALAEMARVTRPGGTIVAELYNPLSLRALAKRLGPAGAISEKTDESAVYTRFDAPWRVPGLLPRGCRVRASRGVRIVTPTAHAMKIPVLRSVLRRAEWMLADSPAAIFGGFWIAAIEKAR